MTLTASQAGWLRVRSYLQEHRHALAVEAAGDYPDERRMAGTPLLAAPEWQPAGPVPLHDIELEFIHTRGTHAGTPPRTPAACPLGRGGIARAAGRHPLPLLLRGAAGPGRPGGVREPPHLPARRGRPHQAQAGVHPRPLLRRRRHRRGGRARVRRHPARRPGRAPPGRPASPDRGPVRPEPPPGQPGHHHADAPVRRGHRAGVVPAALAGPGQGGPRGRDVPGDPGRRVPAVRRGPLARARGLLAVAVHAPRVRRGTPRAPREHRGL